jgi:hypothetical protein
VDRYAAELGTSFSGLIAVTDDVNVAAFENLKRAVEDEVGRSIAATFKALRFEGAQPRPEAPAKPVGDGGRRHDGVPRMREGQDIAKLGPLGVYGRRLNRGTRRDATRTVGDGVPQDH